MIRNSSTERFLYFNHLGFHNPYWIRRESEIEWYENSHDLIGEVRPHFDFVGFVEMINLGYCLGDRTLVKELRRSPWMAKPSSNNKEWEHYVIPVPREKSYETSEIATELFSLLKDELRQYIALHSTIGMLLTGGMDSRIVACVLNDLIASGEAQHKSVIAFTWGLESSRDVVYARKLAKIFGWEWVHLTVDALQMQKNIQICIEKACEFSPLHLHAMSQLAARKDIDCYLAASFGDSIGRGEYSGCRVLSLDPLGKSIKNPMSILRNDFVNLLGAELNEDLTLYWKRFPREKDYQNHELDRQGHYMRRMLNSCMSVIDEGVPLYQMFAAPPVYEYIWSVSPNNRNDLIYEAFLEKYNPQLLDIPWARTGLRYPYRKGEKDYYSKNHHNYSQMIREHFIPFIRDSFRDHSEIIRKLCNVNVLNQLLNNCVKYPIEGQYRNEDRLLYLACVIEFIAQNNIELGHLSEYSGTSFASKLKSNVEYKLRYLYKSIKS